MTSTPQTAVAHAWFTNDMRASHACSLARRMLAGDGAVELTAYRAGETLSSAVHGVSRSGQLVVADIPNLFHSLGAFHTADDIEVRMDVVKDSADHLLALRLASLHLLGTLRWCRDTDEVAALGLQGHVAELVNDVGPRVRVGVVSTERILLHDCSGVTVHDVPIVAEAAAATPSTTVLADAVLATDAQTLAEVADAVLDGRLPGWSENLDVPEAATLTGEPAHCVDIARQFVTLARFTADQGHIVQVPLPASSNTSPEQDGHTSWHRLVDTLTARGTTALRP